MVIKLRFCKAEAKYLFRKHNLSTCSVHVVKTHPDNSENVNRSQILHVNSKLARSTSSPYWKTHVHLQCTCVKCTALGHLSQCLIFCGFENCLLKTYINGSQKDMSQIYWHWQSIFCIVKYLNKHCWKLYTLPSSNHIISKLIGTFPQFFLYT